MNRKGSRISRAIFVILFLGVTAFYCTFPLFSHQGLPYAQDMVFHIFQADQFNRSIHEGFFLPKWIPDSNNGYGSPSFIFYSPLSYYAVAFIKLFVPSLVVSMVVAIWCSFFLSGLTMFIAARRLFGDSGSLLSAMIYQILPFHIMDIYLRGTFAEIFAFVWFPLIFLYLHETLSPGKNKTAFIALSVSYAGLILTHLASGFIFSIAAGVFLIYHFFFGEKNLIPKVILSLVVGLGLASFYLIPAALERKFVQIQYLIDCPVGDYKKNFLFVGEKFKLKLGDFYLPLHVGVVLEVLLFLFVIFWMRKNRQRLSHKSEMMFFVLLFLFALFLTTPLSFPLWKLIPGLPTLQFPWRWLSALEVSLCFLLGAISFNNESAGRDAMNLKRLLIYFIVTLLLVSFVMISRSRTLPETFIERILNPEQIKYFMDPPIEYTPVWAKEAGIIVSETRNEKVSVISGSASIRVSEWTSEKRVLSVKATSPSVLRVSTFYYPGWKAWLDGNTIEIKIEKESGAMLLGIPKGEYTVELRFTDTQLRLLSNFVTLVSFSVAILLLTVFRKRRARASSEG